MGRFQRSCYTQRNKLKIDFRVTCFSYVQYFCTSTYVFDCRRRSAKNMLLL